MSFPAHINKDEAEQTVDQHCRNVAEISRNHLRRLNLADTAYLAGLLHDAGKCTDEFRNYLEKASHTPWVDRSHICSSPIFAEHLPFHTRFYDRPH